MDRAWDIVRQSSAMPRKSSHKMKKVDGATRGIGMQGRYQLCSRALRIQCRVHGECSIGSMCTTPDCLHSGRDCYMHSSYKSAVLLGFIAFQVSFSYYIMIIAAHSITGLRSWGQVLCQIIIL